MRTTLTIEDRIARHLKELAHRSGKPFKTVVNETLRAGLAANAQPRKTKRCRLPVASMGRVAAGIDLTKALALADALEDEELIRKMELRK